MGVVQYRNSVVRTKEAVLREDLFRMRDAIDQYYADKAKYPASLEALVSDGYLRQVPKDPITNSSDTWQTVPSEPDPSNPDAEIGIFDVKSGSDSHGDRRFPLRGVVASQPSVGSQRYLSADSRQLSAVSGSRRSR